MPDLATETLDRRRADTAEPAAVRARFASLAAAVEGESLGAPATLAVHEPCNWMWQFSQEL
jgi:hypothetical protein